MSAGLKGNRGTLRDLERTLDTLPRVLGAEVAKGCADVITRMSRGTFDASEDAYGDPWPLSDAGDTVTLKKSGTLSRGNRYVAIGTTLRAQLGPRYAKYQVGLRPVFPRNGLPRPYIQAIDAKAKEIISTALAVVN